MPKKVRKIALDIAETSFIENYRIKAYHGVIDYAREHTSWKLMYNISNFSLTNKFTQYEDLVSLGVEGLIFLNWDERNLDRIRSTGLPAVSITDVPTVEDFPCALSDDLEVGRMTAQHLLQKGFRHFAYCGSNVWSWSKDREKGFSDTVKAVGFDCGNFHYAQESDADPHRDEAIAKELRAWLHQAPKPIGVLGENDTCALHVLETCHQLNLQVPNEVAIVGVDNNVMICNSQHPSISSVEQNTERVGYAAAELLDSI